MNKKRGFTLMEILVALVMAPIVLLAAAALIVAEYNNYMTIQSNVAAAREARIAINQMTDVLRFAKRGSVNVNPAGTTINATIEGDHLTYIGASDTAVTYAYDGTNDTISYTQGTSAAIVIANNITAFNATWNNPVLVISITATRNNASITLRTQVVALPT